jgi:RNA polymerase sigma factor (sigma-70 family)
VSKLHIESMLSEKELIDGCARGNRAMQKALYERYCPKMMVICLRYARSTQEAEDVLQEGFIKVFAGIKSFRAESKLGTWITRIMINTALNSQRQKLYLFPMVDVTDAALHEDENISLSSFHLSELVSMIQTLPDGCRIVFNLFAIEGYNHKEISDLLKISEGTSKSQYSRAKILLRNKLAERKEYEKFGETKI